MRYKHIVFDIDGTLIDTEYAVLHSLQDTLIAVTGINREINELTFALGIPGKNALKKNLTSRNVQFRLFWGIGKNVCPITAIRYVFSRA